MNKYFFALLLWLAPTHLNATPLVADLSNYQIYVDSGFNGTRMFLFGTRNDAGDIVIVVRGPTKNYMVRKKESVAGIWVNRERMKFYGVPDFYVTASSRPLHEITQYDIFRQLGIGKTHLLSAPHGKYNKEKYRDFSKAFIQHQEERRLYSAGTMPISFMAETLFKMVIDFPDTIPPGNYTAEIFLISDGRVVGMQSIPIEVKKTGLDAFVYNMAHHHPALYGIFAVLIALAAGWFGGRLFGKN